MSRAFVMYQPQLDAVAILVNGILFYDDSPFGVIQWRDRLKRRGWHLIGEL
jgi:hypothetical protein